MFSPDRKLTAGHTVPRLLADRMQRLLVHTAVMEAFPPPSLFGLPQTGGARRK